jgi:phosphoglycolate phosphatase
MKNSKEYEEKFMSNLLSKRNLLFDLDGTIIDPKEGITKGIQFSLQKFGIQVEDRDTLTPFIGPPLRDSFIKFYGFNDEEAVLAVKEYREYFAPTGVFENFLYDGIVNIFEKQREAGRQLVIATSKPTVYAEKILEYHKIRDYFSFVAGSELDGRRSKKGEVIQYALENMKITSVQDTIMIGDREHDVIGAREAGLDSIGVLYGYGDLKELTDAGATYIAKDVGELSHLLG